MLDAVDNDGLRLPDQVDDPLDAQDVWPFEHGEDVQPSLEAFGIKRFVKRQTGGVDMIVMAVQVMMVMVVMVAMMMAMHNDGGGGGGGGDDD